MNRKMKVKIKPGVARGRLSAPPSKSYAHRLLLGAALARGSSVISGINLNEDLRATLDCLTALGVSYQISGDQIRVAGNGGQTQAQAVYPCRESGSTLRFFLPLALRQGQAACFTGSQRLLSRGVGLYEQLWPDLLWQKEADFIKVQGRLQAGEYQLPGDVSSQFVSGLLFALPLLEGDSQIKVLPPVESRPYIDLSLEVLKLFGLEIHEPKKNTFYVKGGQAYHSLNQRVEGDWSNAAFWYALNTLGGKVQITGLNPDSLQGDRACLLMLQQLQKPGAVLDLADCPDLGPVLLAVAAAQHGGKFFGTRRLRIKESDRAAAMAEELAKFGVQVEVEGNSVRVASGGIQPPRQILYGHKDHRIVMALAILASLVGGEIAGAEAVSKSYPEFFAILGQLGVKIEHEPEV